LTDLCFPVLRFNHFEEEEVDPSSWAADWLFRLLSKELSLPCLLRLWDTYFSEPEGLELHPYVCLAVLKFFSDQLDDLEHSEILAFVRCLPAMDMDEVMAPVFFSKNQVKLTSTFTQFLFFSRSSRKLPI